MTVSAPLSRPNPLLRLGRDGLARDIARELQRQGWRITIGKHVSCVPPDKGQAIVVCPASGSDHRGLQNWLSDLRRSGFVWEKRQKRRRP